MNIYTDYLGIDISKETFDVLDIRLATFLYSKDIAVSVVNPLRIKRFFADAFMQE